MPLRRAARRLRTVFDYAGVLVLWLLGVACVAAGLARDDASLLIAGGIITVVAVVWAVAGRGRGGGLVP